MKKNVQQLMKIFVKENQEKLKFALTFAAELSNNFSYEDFNNLLKNGNCKEIENYLKKYSETKQQKPAFMMMFIRAFFEFDLIGKQNLEYFDYLKLVEERINVTSAVFVNLCSAGKMFILYGKELRESGWIQSYGIYKLARLETAYKAVGNLDEVLQRLKIGTREDFNKWYLTYSNNKKGSIKSVVKTDEGKILKIPYPEDFTADTRREVYNNISYLIECYKMNKTPVIIPFDTKEEAEKIINQLGL